METNLHTTPFTSKVNHVKMFEVLKLSQKLALKSHLFICIQMLIANLSLFGDPTDSLLGCSISLELY